MATVKGRVHEYRARHASRGALAVRYDVVDMGVMVPADQDSENRH